MTPEMPVQQRAQGGYTPAVDTDPHNGGPCGCDWSIPTTAALLRHRVLSAAIIERMRDECRYPR